MLRHAPMPVELTEGLLTPPCEICTKRGSGEQKLRNNPPSKFCGDEFSSFYAVLLTNQPTQDTTYLAVVLWENAKDLTLFTPHVSIILRNQPFSAEVAVNVAVNLTGWTHGTRVQCCSMELPLISHFGVDVDRLDSSHWMPETRQSREAAAS